MKRILRSRSAFVLPRKRQIAFTIASIAAVVPIVGAVWYNVADRVGGASAIEQQQNTKIKRAGGYVFENFPEYNFEVEVPEYEKKSKLMLGGAAGGYELPDFYDSRSYNYISRQENQAGENICWAYSFTTVAESYLLKSGLVQDSVELSPKQLDYAAAPASEAFIEPVINKYEDFMYNVTGFHREISDPGNFYQALVASSGKYLMDEDDVFFGKMKLNDPSSLSGFDSYGDFAYHLIEVPVGDGAYRTKQKVGDVFGGDDTKYTVASAKLDTGDEYDALGNGDQRQDVAYIKKDIKDYGAVAISIHYNDMCIYKDSANYTIIDRTTEANADACGGVSAGHAVTLVGWDDNWSYRDNGVDKKGAFIVQNSYGNDGINYYLSFTSSKDMMLSITDMNETDSFDDVLDLSDYNKVVNAEDYSVTFDFVAGDSYMVSELSILTGILASSNPELGWDVYVKRGSEPYEKIGWIQDHDEVIRLDSVSNIGTSVGGAFSVKVKYNPGKYKITGLTPDAFANMVAPYMTATVYLNERTGNTSNIHGDEHTKNDGIDLSFDIDYAVDLFESITVDGAELSEYDYAVFDDTSVTIAANFLDTLEIGDHVVVVSFSNGKNVELDFSVLEREWTGAITNTQGIEHKKDDGADLSFDVDYALSSFETILVDSTELNDDSYAISGNTTIVIFSGFLDTLSEGQHTIKANFADGKVVELIFSVSGETVPIPDTSGDGSADHNNAAPNTGYNTESQEMANELVFWKVTPIAIAIVVVIAGYIAICKKMLRK